MLLFCPTCSNVLTLSRLPRSTDEDDEDEDAGRNRFECRTCPYSYELERPFYEKKKFTPKKAEDIIGGEESLKMLERANVPCKDQTCDSEEAYVRQAQVRSADEGMTSFYTCCKCLRKWQEN